MQPIDRIKLAETLAVIYAAKTKSISNALVELFFQTLQEYDIEAVCKAMFAHMRNPDTGMHVPQPADIVRMIAGSTGDRAMDAWALVERAIRQIGPMASVAFQDGVIHRVIDDMGGWIRLCSTSNEEDLRFRGIEFQKRCRGFWLGDKLGRDFPSYLIGEAEAFNRAAGRPHKVQVELIGRTPEAKARAQRVMSLGNPIGEANPVKSLISGMKHLKLVKATTGGESDTSQNELEGPKQAQSGQDPADGSGSIPNATPAAK